MSATPTAPLEALSEAKARVPLVLRQLMAYTGLRTKDIAWALDLTPPAISARLTGSTVIKQEELWALAFLFDVPSDVLYLAPDDALRYVIDHPSERRQHTISDLRLRIKRWIDRAA